MSVAVEMATIVDALSGVGATVIDERELSDALATLFDSYGLSYEREARISPKDRLDFLMNGVAVEVKIEASWSALVRQLARYAAHARVQGIVVVTTRRQLSALPPVIEGKPVRVAYVGAL